MLPSVDVEAWTPDDMHGPWYRAARYPAHGSSPDRAMQLLRHMQCSPEPAHRALRRLRRVHREIRPPLPVDGQVHRQGQHEVVPALQLGVGRLPRVCARGHDAKRQRARRSARQGRQPVHPPRSRLPLGPANNPHRWC
ncbi:hypothetical protein, variant, partial [Aphanomyces invadans]